MEQLSETCDARRFAREVVASLLMAKGSRTPLQPTKSAPAAPPSKRLAARRAALASTQGDRAVRAAFFARGQRVAMRHGVSVDDVVRHLSRTALAPDVWQSKWMDDLILAIACARGDHDAWGVLTLAHGWRLREVAAEALGAASAPLAVARFFAVMRRDAPASFATFDGRTSLSHWLGARFASTIGTQLPRLDRARLDTAQASRTLLLRSEGRCAEDSLAT